MTEVYLDNAATTSVHPEVIKVVNAAMVSDFGNPSSTHRQGRAAKAVIEMSRKKIAKYFNVSSSEIVFTSGGTESNNFILFNAVLNLGVKRIITTKIEHSSVLNPIKHIQEKYNVDVVFLDLDEFGNISLNQLDDLLSIVTVGKTLVSLMMVNNEIGNLLPVKDVSFLCKKHQVLFHSDTVQAVGLYKLDLQEIPIDFISVSAHKLHGPKGVGFVYVNKEIYVNPMFYGGLQEKGLRPGTENTPLILGMQKAFELSFCHLNEKFSDILELKKYCINTLKKEIPGVLFNGMSSDFEKSSPTILNVLFPSTDKLLLFYLDLQGVSVSYGSACQSGAYKRSYVLEGLPNHNNSSKISIRVSFSQFNTVNDVKNFIKILKSVLK